MHMKMVKELKKMRKKLLKSMKKLLKRELSKVYIKIIRKGKYQYIIKSNA